MTNDTHDLASELARSPRLVLVGNSGSGKSTLARAIARIGGHAHLDLDTVAWEPEQIAVARPSDVAAADVRSFCAAHERWVAEGCYADLAEVALASTPLLVLLDPGVERCVAHCLARPFEPHKYASKEEQDARLELLLAWVRAYEQREGPLGRAAHVALFDAYSGAKRLVR